MRHVFDNRQVAHVWANQTQEDGRSNNGQLYFRGKTIYSYRDNWPLAEFTDRYVDGQRVVILNTDKYGTTTTRHLGYVYVALHGLAVYQVESDGAWLYGKRRRTPEPELFAAIVD